MSSSLFAGKWRWLGGGGGTRQMSPKRIDKFCHKEHRRGKERIFHRVLESKRFVFLISEVVHTLG